MPDWPSLVSPSMVSVFVGRGLSMTLLPPALKWILKLKRQLRLTKYHEEKNENQTNSKKRHHQVEVLHLFRCSIHRHTHTHCMRSGTFGLKSAHTGDKGGGSNDSWPLNSLRMVISARTSIEEIWQLLWCHCWMVTG